MILEEEQKKLIKDFLSLCGLEISNLENLEGMIIYRETLLSLETYNKVRNKIIGLKSIFSSSNHTAMHADAYKKQRWPLINIVRQVLRGIGYEMEPRRLSDGYSEEGKKSYRRIFVISREINNKIENVNEEYIVDDDIKIVEIE